MAVRREKSNDIVYRIRCVESYCEEIQEGDVLAVYSSLGDDYVYVGRKKVYVGYALDVYGDFVTE